MVGRATYAPQRELELYRGSDVQAYGGTYLTLLTAIPPNDVSAFHGAPFVQEWGPARIQVFANSGLGSPYWSDPIEFGGVGSRISNVGSAQWLSITLATSPNTVLGFALYDAATGGNLVLWDEFDDPQPVVDGQDFVLGTGVVEVRAT